MEDTRKEERLEKDCTVGSILKLPKNKKIKCDNHAVKKRGLSKFPRHGKDVFVRKKSSTKTLITFCKKLLDTEHKEIKIHGLGITCNKAINVGRRLIEKYSGTYGMDIETDPVILIDDLEPTNDDAYYELKKRSLKAVHIRVFPIAHVGPLRIEN